MPFVILRYEESAYFSSRCFLRQHDIYSGDKILRPTGTSFTKEVYDTIMNTELFTSHGFELSDTELAQFEKFLELFVAYNTHTNLSAIRDAEGIIEKHFVDSLYGASVIGEFSENHPDRTLRLLDIGSGGGFPGIPLKLILPELQVTLLDSVGKKVKAMNHFVSELGLIGI